MSFKRPYSEISNDEVIINIQNNITNIEQEVEYLSYKQHQDSKNILHKIRIFECILVVELIIIWSLILK